MDVAIRRANNGDVYDICRVFRSAVRGLAREHYSSEQIEVWASRLSQDSVRDGITIGCVYVAVVDGEVAGFGRIDLHSAEISMLFVDPAYALKGIGTGILKHLEQLAVEKGLGSVHLRASLNAASFYRSMGYCEDEAITHRIDDTDFLCIIMHKNLR